MLELFYMYPYFTQMAYFNFSQNLDEEEVKVFMEAIYNKQNHYFWIMVLTILFVI